MTLITNAERIARQRLARLDKRIAEMEQRVLNARTVEAAKDHHDKLDRLRAERARWVYERR